MKTNIEIAELLLKNNLRIDRMFYLGSELLGNYEGYDFLDILEDQDHNEEEILALFPDISATNHDLKDALREYKKFGFVLEVAAASDLSLDEKNRLAPIAGCSYYSGLVYGNTLEEAVQQGVQWAFNIRNEEK